MKAEALFRDLRRGNSQGSGLLCRKIMRLQPDWLAAIQNEVNALCQHHLPSNVRDPEHITHWTQPFGGVYQFSLFNRSGCYDDFSSDHDHSCLHKHFHGQEAYPALAKLMADLPHLVNFRVNLLSPHSGLHAHKENLFFLSKHQTVAAKLRFHLPIKTNPGAEVMLAGQIHHLEAGTIYFVHHGCAHSAHNQGDGDRLHLVWDMLLTRDTFQWMQGHTAPCNTALQPIPEDEASCMPLRLEPIGAIEQLVPLIAPHEQVNLAFCLPQ
jgi:hypothetical protein